MMNDVVDTDSEIQLPHYQLFLPCPKGRAVARLTNLESQENNRPAIRMTMERKLTAILSADVKGYSRLMGEDEVATVRTLTAYRAVIAAFTQQHHGRVVDSPGDN